MYLLQAPVLTFLLLMLLGFARFLLLCMTQHTLTLLAWQSRCSHKHLTTSGMLGCTSCCVHRRRLETGQLCWQLWFLHLSPLCCCSWLLIVILQLQGRTLILRHPGLPNPCMLQYDGQCTYGERSALIKWCLTRF